MSPTTIMAGGLGLAVAVAIFMWQIEHAKVKRRDTLINAYQATVALSDNAVRAAQQAAAESDAALQEAQAEAAHQRELAAKYETQARARDAATRAALKRIANAPNSDDGPVAPILRYGLDRLRVVGGTDHDGGQAPGGDNSGQTGTADAAKQPDVPPASATP